MLQIKSKYHFKNKEANFAFRYVYVISTKAGVGALHAYKNRIGHLSAKIR